MSTVLVIERKLRRKGSKWQAYDTGEAGCPIRTVGVAKMRMEYFADHLPHDFRIAKYRRIR